MRALLLTIGLCLAQGAVAQQIDRSPLPPANPRLTGSLPTEMGVAAAATPRGDVMATSLRPMPRPQELADRTAAPAAAATAPGLDLTGKLPEEEIDMAAIPPPSKTEERRKKREMASRQGSVCGMASIKGKKIAPIVSKVEGCGVEDPVAITSVSGVRLSQTATVDCSTAKALNAWVDEAAQPAFDGNLVEMQVAAHYACRSRNNIKGAKISEHGKGKAIDITAFTLSDGTVLSVARDYGRLLRRIHKAACSYFRTTLGPGSDGYHEDNLHFDTSARKGLAYCR